MHTATLSLWALLSPALAASPPLRDDCGDVEVVPPPQLIAAAHDAVRGLEGARFLALAEGVGASVACADEPLDPGTVAQLHGVVALRALYDDRSGEAVNALRSALAADPAFEFPDGVAQPGHPILLRLETARGMAGSPTRSLRACEGVVYVDGRPAEGAASDRPLVLQLVSADQAVVSAAYVGTGAPLPEWSDPLVTCATDVVSAEAPRRRVGAKAAPWVLGVASAGTLALGGALYGGAWAAYLEHCPQRADGERECPVTSEEDFWSDTLRPQFRWGVGLMAAGGVGLAGTSLVVALSQDGPRLSLVGHW